MELHVVSGRDCFYGGSQKWFEKRYERLYGCGIIGGANVVACLKAGRSDQGEVLMGRSSYLKICRKLAHCMPVIPGAGLDGFRLALGMNLYFIIHRMPYRAVWGVSKGHIMQETERMLEDGIPVILSAGRNFPKLMGKKSVGMYQTVAGTEKRMAACRGHYVTVFDMDDTWLTVSSWGNRYRIRKAEYMDYVTHHSNALFSNILKIRKTGK